MRKKIILTILSSILFNSIAPACTVWGSITVNELLIAKNRDFYPGNQKFMLGNTKGKYKYFGLYGDNQYDGKYTLKMGINESGLTVFMTFASTIPLAKRTAKLPYYRVMENILENYNNVDGIYANSSKLFKDSTPINYIFADRNKALICEIGLNNDYKCDLYLRSNQSKVITFTQTNHYVINGLERYNLTPFIKQQTSYYRYSKINKLMEDNLTSLTFRQFINFSLNTQAINDSPLVEFDRGYNNTYQDNSIFRTFNSHPDRKNKNHKNSDQNVSTMIVKLPSNKDKPIELYLRIIDKITDLNDNNYTQNIKYSEATVTLDNAIKNPNLIKYTEKACVRDISSKLCK